MIELKSDVSILIYESEDNDGTITVSHYDEENDQRSLLVMTRERAIQLAGAIMKVADEVE